MISRSQVAEKRETEEEGERSARSTRRGRVLFVESLARSRVPVVARSSLRLPERPKSILESSKMWYPFRIETRDVLKGMEARAIPPFDLRFALPSLVPRRPLLYRNRIRRHRTHLRTPYRRIKSSPVVLLLQSRRHIRLGAREEEESRPTERVLENPYESASAPRTETRKPSRGDAGLEVAGRV